MRGSSDPQLAMLTTVSTEDLIPADHPIRKIRVVVDAVLAELDPVFDEMYAASGRRSVPPEALLKSTVLMAMYSIRSERAFCERLNYDLLFKWFLDMRIDQTAFDATTFTKNRTRLLEHDVADEFFAAVVRQAKLRKYISSDHFSVDGTLLNAWASHKSFKPKDGPPSEPPAGRNVEVQWHGEKRSNDTHASTTDPEARLYRKSHNTAATLCYAGHLLIEHRSALNRRRRTDRCRRLRRTGHGARDARPAASVEAATHARGRQELRHERLRRRRPSTRVHPARRPERERQPQFCDRRSHHPTRRPHRLAANTQTGRGTLRLDQDDRRRTQAALHRPTTQPSLVQDQRRGLQPDPNRRPRHETRLTTPPSCPT
jgi:transposase